MFQRGVIMTSRSPDVSIETSNLKDITITAKLHLDNNAKLDPDFISKLSQDKAIKDLSSLYKLSFLMYNVKDIKKLLSNALDLIFKATYSDCGTILVQNDDSSELIPIASTQEKSCKSKSIKVNFSILDQSFHEKVAILCNKPEKDTTKKNTGHTICVPIATTEKTFGIIYLNSRSEANPFSEDTLKLVSAISNQIAIALENLKFHEQNDTATTILHTKLKEMYNMVGVSPEIKNVFSTINKITSLNSAVLITGESGTGKELVARALHYNSSRANKPFVCINCTTLPETLIESELFGHEKGAFTGAFATKPGQFEICNGGTLFLDEIVEMPITSQSKLLRALEEGKIRHVGGTKDIDVDVRIITASNMDMKTALKNNLIREDLYYRIKVLQIILPPLRNRKDDIPVLAQYYFDKYKTNSLHPIKGFSKEAHATMLKYPWHGNVRELKNCIERASIMCSGDHIEPFDLGLPKAANLENHTDSVLLSLNDLERKHIIRVLKETEGNKSRAAEILGIRRSTLYEKIKLYNILA